VVLNESPDNQTILPERVKTRIHRRFGGLSISTGVTLFEGLSKSASHLIRRERRRGR
jgi:hypothetical protein